MLWRSIPFVKEAVLFAGAFLLMAPQVLAGDIYRKATVPITSPRPQPVAPVVARVVPQPVTISIVVPEPPPPAKEQLSVSLRGPDGQVRSFAVEGGRDAIQVRRVILRPGESVTVLLGQSK